MITSINSATGSISSSYTDAIKQMSASLARLGSGKRFQTASEDLADYLKVNSIQTSANLLESSKTSISRSKAFIEVASAYGSNLLDQLEDLKGAAFERENATGDELTAATAKFDGIRASISETLNTAYNGTGLNTGADTTFEILRMGNGGSLELEMLAADVVTYANTAWDADGYADTATAIDGEIDNVTAMIARIGGYQAQVDAQESFVNTMLENFNAAEKTITEINEASEMAEYIASDIRQQTAISMLSQANMSKFSILGLYR